jgi:phosphosulfolactate synthase (CoM biosynthesis protein A)
MDLFDRNVNIYKNFSIKVYIGVIALNINFQEKYHLNMIKRYFKCIYQIGINNI